MRKLTQDEFFSILDSPGSAGEKIEKILPGFNEFHEQNVQSLFSNGNPALGVLSLYAGWRGIDTRVIDHVADLLALVYSLGAYQSDDLHAALRLSVPNGVTVH